MKPNKENLRKWVKALRSGLYKQIKGVLKISKSTKDVGLSRLNFSKDGYCCLGVACEIYRQETGEGFWNGADEFVTPLSHYPEAQVLTIPVMDWLGIASSNPKVSGHYLAEWNDKENASFEQIADLIEEKYEL